MKLPIVIVNFKTYEESTGANALFLAKQIQKASIDLKKNVAICVQAIDARVIANSVSIPVLAQHIDHQDFGSNTGHHLIKVYKKAGIKGAIINHSENRIPKSQIEQIVKKAKKENFYIIVCVKDEVEAKEYSKFKPDLIAVEPPELIGGDISVSLAKPEIITKTVKNSTVPILTGAGVHTTEDVKISIELGAKGVLVASGVVKAKDSYEETKDLLKGLI